jgi:DivIVA domain-containing protein
VVLAPASAAPDKTTQMMIAALTTTRFTEASPAECNPVAWSHAGRTHHTGFAREGRLAGVTFRRVGPRGYDTEAVDWFLDQLRGPENYSEPPEMGADPWRDLPVATGSPRFRGARRCGVTLLLTTSEDYDRWADPAVRSRR